jgi:DNA phosphorothioation-dependent restriction protein DptH
VDQQSAKVLAREIGHYLDCHTRCDEEGRTNGLNLLHLHAFKAGDGLVVGRALGQALKGRPAELTEEGDEGERDLCFVLDLFASEGRDDATGRFLLDLARRRRSGAGAIDPDDRWMLETVSRPGEISIPRLRWARRGGQTPAAPSHLAFAFDTFVSQLEPIPAHSLPQEQRPLHGYGLVLQMERRVELGDTPTWRTFPALKYEGEKHPVSRALTDRLARLQDSIARATALRLGGDRSDWPVLTTRLPLESQERIQALHRSADWVITADRNVCIEYFDSPRNARTVYDAYIIDCVPERNDLGCLQLVTSTCNIEEVRDLFDEMLGQMGLSSSARNCEFVLGHLKGLSGRLAIRLASPATKSGELVALALVHAHCVEALGHDPVWLPLTDGFFIPLDEITDIVPSAGDETGEGQRADLVYITAGARQPLVFRFVEVKFRRHLRTARSSELLEKMVEQTRSVRRRWEEYFFGPRLSPTTRALRRSALVRLLNFYGDKARRHHLSAEAHERLRGEIDKLLLQGDSYVLAEPEKPECGYIFCPELRTVDNERLYAAGSEGTSIYLFGPAFLPDATVGATRPPSLGVSATPVDPAAEGSAQVDGFPPTPPSETGAENVDQHPRALETRNEAPLDVVLGANRTTDERVVWQLSIKANPHLMIVGLPGMGKTTSLVNLCQQIYATGITPVVFSYHQDIDARLEAACGPLNLVDFNGLGFNPLQIDSVSPLAHVDVASELRDIFAAIFPDLGDIQTEEIRQAIKQSYADLGWGGGESHAEHPTIPPFQAFFNILRAKPKPNAGVMARLTELSDYGFFETAGSRRSLLDVGRPSVLRIHRTSNALLQRAFASFVLYSIYKDMFRRGPQPALTHVVIFDEAHRASRLKLLPTMAKECRKFGISLILASQEVRDFDPALFSAIASYLALRVTEYDAKVIAKIASSSEIEKRVIDRLKQLAKYTGLFFTEGNSRPVQIALLGGGN